MTRLLRMVAGWKGYVAVFALAFALGFGGTWKLRDWMAAEALSKSLRRDLKAANVVIERTQKAATITEGVGQTVETQRERVRVETRTIIEKVPVYVTVEADRLWTVSAGFVRLHDAAASGSASALSDSAGESVDAPSGVAPSAVAETVAGNYGQCLEWRATVIGWQDWYRQQRAAWESPGP